MQSALTGSRSRVVGAIPLSGLIGAHRLRLFLLGSDRRSRNERPEGPPFAVGSMHRSAGDMGTVNAGLFTSTTDEWPTPRDLVATLDHEFGFTLDPCASADNAVCGRFYTKAEDGLSQPWFGSVYMNPPYGRQIGAWVEKAYRSALSGATVVCLIPARTDTAYWHDYVMRAAEVRLIRGRLNFDCERQQDRKATGKSAAHNAPFPSAIIVFRPDHFGLPMLSAVTRTGHPTIEMTAVRDVS